MLEPFDQYGRLNIDACMESFMPYLEANRRTTNTVFHASLNPSPEDKLTDEQLRDIAREYMERMGYGNQPYIVFKHKDIAREHLHIVSLRVDERGPQTTARFRGPALDGDTARAGTKIRPASGASRGRN